MIHDNLLWKIKTLPKVYVVFFIFFCFSINNVCSPKAGTAVNQSYKKPFKCVNLLCPLCIYNVNSSLLEVLFWTTLLVEHKTSSYEEFNNLVEVHCVQITFSLQFFLLTGWLWRVSTCLQSQKFLYSFEKELKWKK